MAVVLKPTVPAVFDLKSAAMTVVAVVLRTTDLTLLAAELETRFGGSAQLFDQDPVVIDLSPVRDDDLPLDVASLVTLLRRYRMVPIAVKGGSIVQMDDALALGLGAAPEGAPPREDPPPPAPAPASAAQAGAAPPVLREVVVAQPRTALLIDKPLRSGQQVYAKGGDLVVMAAVSFGAEVIADGSVHVYAPLRGRAIAGARGDTSARIFSTCMEPQLVSIAGTYRTLEAPLPDEVLGKPAQVRLDGEKLVVEALRH